MSQAETPRVLVVSPRYTVPQPPSYTRLAALCDAVEAQAPSLVSEWLPTASPQALTDALRRAEAALLALHVSCDEADDVLLDGGNGSGPVSMPLSSLADRLSASGVGAVLLMPRAGGEKTAATLAQMLETAGIPVVLVPQTLSDQALSQALLVFFTELIGGASVAEALATVDSGGEVVCLGAGERRVMDDVPSEHSGVSKVIAFPGTELLPPWKRIPEVPRAGGLPLVVRRPLAGREAERAQLEAALWKEQGGPLWLYGYAGIGKTHLMAETARWMVRVGRFQRVVYSSFCSGGMAEWAIYDLGKALLGRGFDPASPAARDQVIEALEATPTLVIWDEMDALMGEGRWPLGAEAWQELVELAQAVGATSASRLCLLSDTLELSKSMLEIGEPSLALALGGLSTAEGQMLLGDDDDAAQSAQLVEALGGQAMALAILRPFVIERSAAGVLAGLCEIMPGIAGGDGRLRNQGLAAAIEYLLRTLPDEMQFKLARMGVLCGGAMQPMALGMAGIGMEDWAPVRQALLDAGVLSEEELPGFKVGYLRLHSAFLGHLDRRIVSTGRKAVLIEYYGRFLGISQWMVEMESRSTDLVRFMTHQDLGNFRATLAAMLADEKLTLANGYLQRLDHYCGLVGLSGERERMRAMATVATQKALPAEGPLARPGVRFLLGQAEQLLGTGRLQQAMAMMQPFVQRIMAEEALSYEGAEAALDRATALHLMSQGMAHLGRPNIVAGALSQAVSLLSDHSQDDAVGQRLMAVRQDLADLLARAGQVDGARDQYAQAMALAARFADADTTAGLHRRLGALASAQRDKESAQDQFNQALALYKEVDDKASMMGVLQQLAALMRQTEDQGQAKAYNTQALALAQEAGADVDAAQIMISLAQIAQQEEQLGEAKALYVQAISKLNEKKARGPLISAEMALAELLLVEGALLEARAHAEAARSVAAGGNPERVSWGIYGLLQRIAGAEGNQDAERMWRLRAQEAFGASREAEGMRRHWAPLVEAVSASCRGEALDVETVQMVEKLEEASEWQGLAETIWRLLNGERDEDLYANADYVDALVIRSILHAIEHPPEPEEDEGEAS